MVSYPCGPPSSLDTGISMVSIGSRLVCPQSGCPVQGRGRGIESWERAFLENPLLLAKNPALMVRADTTAPVVNDEEKRARATTEVHKVARDGYGFDVGPLAFWAGCDRATTLVAGARHIETDSSARSVPAEPQAICAKLRVVWASCKAEVVARDPFRLPSGIGDPGAVCTSVGGLLSLEQAVKAEAAIAGDGQTPHVTPVEAPPSDRR